MDGNRKKQKLPLCFWLCLALSSFFFFLFLANDTRIHKGNINNSTKNSIELNFCVWHMFERERRERKRVNRHQFRRLAIEWPHDCSTLVCSSRAHFQWVSANNMLTCSLPFVNRSLHSFTIIVIRTSLSLSLSQPIVISILNNFLFIVLVSLLPIVSFSFFLLELLFLSLVENGLSLFVWHRIYALRKYTICETVAVNFLYNI